MRSGAEKARAAATLAAVISYVLIAGSGSSADAAPREPVGPVLAGANARVLLGDCGGSGYDGRERPTQWDRGCTGVRDLTQMVWRTWGGPTALGSGITQLNDCEPSCSGGTVEEFPVAAELSEVRRCQDGNGRVGRFYTRIRMIYELPSNNPYGLPGGVQDNKSDLGCVSPGTSISCSPVGREGPGQAFDVTARRVSCKQARRIAAGARRRACEQGCAASKTRRVTGYRCRFGPFNAARYFLPVRCSSGKRFVSFRFAVD